MPLLGLCDIPFKRRTRWFTRVMREILKHMNIEVVTGYGRPHSEAIAMHTGIWALPWPKWRLDVVDHWFAERLPATVTRGGRCLESLPLADRNLALPQVFLTSIGF